MKKAYEEAVRAQRADLPADADMLDFIRYATLAPNGHNTQPWFFHPDEDGVSIRPDLSRRTPVVDPNDHHLFVSLGCAAENFLIAAAARNRPGVAGFVDDKFGEVRVDLAEGKTADAILCDAIPRRQSTRSDYDGQAIPAGELAELESAADVAGVDLRLITDEGRLEQALELIIEANDVQMKDAAFVRELKDWIRFNPEAALATGDGLYGPCSGNPTAPTWLGRLMFSLAFRRKPEADKYAQQLRSSAGLAVFTAETEGPEGWVQVGRSFERFALKATALGIRTAHLNQPVEVPTVRSEFARWLGAPDSTPDLVIRFGRGPTLPMTLRRPVEAVIVSR